MGLPVEIILTKYNIVRAGGKMARREAKWLGKQLTPESKEPICGLLTNLDSKKTMIIQEIQVVFVSLP